MTIQSRGTKRTRQLSSVLPIYLFSVSLLALAMEEKRKTRGRGAEKMKEAEGASWCRITPVGKGWPPGVLISVLSYQPGSAP